MIESVIASTAAVIRSYNNKHVVKQVRNLHKIGIGKIIVVTDTKKDDGNTRGWLSELHKAGRVEIIELENYSWSNALNQALHRIVRINHERRSCPNLLLYVLNISVEAQFTQEHIEDMLGDITLRSDVAVVGTTFKGIQGGNEVSLGRSYCHPRNTGMIIRLNALGAFCDSFDTWCDEIGGMEDIELILRLMAFNDRQVRMLNLKVPLIVGKNHHQDTKEAREELAMKHIITRMRAFDDKIRRKIRDTVVDMRLEG